MYEIAIPEDYMPKDRGVALAAYEECFEGGRVMVLFSQLNAGGPIVFHVMAPHENEEGLPPLNVQTLGRRWSARLDREDDFTHMVNLAAQNTGVDSEQLRQFILDHCPKKAC